MATFVCSDIHGHYDAWIKALERSDIKLQNGDNLVILGDLIDRGDKSLECVLYALELKEKHPNQVHYLMGNHEKMFLDFVNVDITNPEDEHNLHLNWQTWIGNGGTQTIKSFLKGLPAIYDVHRLMNEKHLQIINQLNQLPYFHVDEHHNCVYVHAGFESMTPLHNQSRLEMIWVRDEFYNSFQPPENDILSNKLIVHGHTPVQYFDDYNGEGFYKGIHHICVDGGATTNNGNVMIVKMDDYSYTLQTT